MSMVPAHRRLLVNAAYTSRRKVFSWANRERWVVVVGNEPKVHRRVHIFWLDEDHLGHDIVRVVREIIGELPHAPEVVPKVCSKIPNREKKEKPE